MNYTVIRKKERLPIHTAAVYPSPYHKKSSMEYVQFVLKEPVLLRIRSQIRVESVLIRPLSLGLVPVMDNGDILLYLDHPVKLSLEINGGAQDNLLVLAEEERYAELRTQDPRVKYFPAGVHKTDILTIDQDHTVVYLEEGACVHGKLVLSRCSHVTVCGYGVICMEQYPYESRPLFARCVDAIECQDVTIRDITIMDSNDWSLRICGCQDVVVDNVKIFGCRGNSDGIDICGSKRVLVQNAFTRVWDDSLVVKALDTGDVEDVTFRNCILWNDFARPMEVGVELRADRVCRVTFENIDVLHSPTGYPLMGIHHGDRAAVSDIVFKNIRIEDAPGAQLFDIRITPSYWNRDTQMGYIRNVLFKDIHMAGRPGLPLLLSQSRLQGYDAAHNIRGVTFENIDICGKTPADLKALGLKCEEYVEEVSVIADEGLSPLCLTETEMELSKAFFLRQDGFYEGEVTVKLRNTASVEREKEVWLKISPQHLGDYDRENKKLRLLPGEERSIVYPVVLQPGKYVIALQSEDPEVQYAWQFAALDWQLGTEVPERELMLVNYWGDRLGGVKGWVEGENLMIDSPLLRRKDCVLALYAAAPVPREPGEVVFSVEETDFGQAPAILEGRHGLETAPQLRCPLEITLVFKNQPKVGRIYTLELCGGEGTVRIPFKQLGICETTESFWLEIEARVPGMEQYHYPYTLFHSVTPLTTAHMYGNCILPGGRAGEEREGSRK